MRGDVKATDGTTGVLLRKALLCAEDLLGSGVVLEEGMTLHAGISIGPANFLMVGGGWRSEWTYLLQARATLALLTPHPNFRAICSSLLSLLLQTPCRSLPRSRTRSKSAQLPHALAWMSNALR